MRKLGLMRLAREDEAEYPHIYVHLNVITVQVLEGRCLFVSSEDFLQVDEKNDAS